MRSSRAKQSLKRGCLNSRKAQMCPEIWKISSSALSRGRIMTSLYILCISQDSRNSGSPLPVGNYSNRSWLTWSPKASTETSSAWFARIKSTRGQLMMMWTNSNKLSPKGNSKRDSSHSMSERISSTSQPPASNITIHPRQMTKVSSAVPPLYWIKTDPEIQINNMFTCQKIRSEKSLLPRQQASRHRKGIHRSRNRLLSHRLTKKLRKIRGEGREKSKRLERKAWDRRMKASCRRNGKISNRTHCTSSCNFSSMRPKTWTPIL